MRLLVHPDNQVDSGISLNAPPSLQPCIIPWAQVDYRVYHFGGILRQNFVSKHFSIYHFVVDVTTPVQLYLHCSQPYVALQFTLQGTCCGALRGGISYEVVEGKTVLFYLAKGLHNGTFNNGRFRSLIIQINSLMLAELAEEIPFFEKLRERVVTLADSGYQLPALSINSPMMWTIEKMARINQKQGALNLAIIAGIFELLNLYNQVLENNEYLGSLTGIHHKAILAEIYHTIVYKPNIRTCRISVFARQYFLSPITLSRYFYRLFNVHLADFVMSKVMQKAVWLLLQTDKSITEISEELGYSSVSNFSRAFNDYQGLSPARLRKGQFL